MESVEALGAHTDVQFWREQGQRLKSLLPADTLIATTAAGAIPYYSRLPTIDLLGLTDEHVAHLPIPCTSQVTIGHCKMAPDAYLLERKVNLIVEPLKAPLSFERAPLRRPGEVLIRIEGDLAMSTIYVERTPALDAIFSTSPDVRWSGARRRLP